MKKRRGWLVVFPGLQTSNGRRLVGIQAGAVVYVPGLQHCYEQTCSPVPVGVWPVIFTPAEQRAEPQPGRANIHRTGNQAHSDLPIKLLLVELRRIALKRRWNQHFKSPSAEKGRSKTCIIVVILRVEASVSADSPAGLPGHNQSSVRSNRETTVYEAPSVVLVRSEVCQTVFLRRHDLAEQVETLSYDSNNL